MHDNTTRHGDQLFAMDADLIAMVQEGMTVQDVTGEELSTVERVKMGDPDAATTRGSTNQRDASAVDILASVFGGGTDVPEPKRSQLLRYGFIRIDGAGLTDSDRFVRADKIKQVAGDIVTLAISKQQLLTEQ
jgi:hypothetical protein